ncbi:MAG TPA: tetratricopeptide repeat protein [Acidisarcina sp.]
MHHIQRVHASAAHIVAVMFVATLIFSPVANAQLKPGSAPADKTLDDAAPDPAPALRSRQNPAKPASLDSAPERQRSEPEELGDLYVVRHRYLDAVSAYQAIAGNSPIIWNKLGIAYQHLFNIQAARGCYEHSLSLDPRYPEALNNFGTVLYAERNYSGAARYYNRALKLSPHSAAIYANLGTAHFAKGDYKRGAKAYREAFHIDPGVFDEESSNKIQEPGSREARAMLSFHLAKFYAGARMNDRALQCLRDALDNGFRDKKRLMADEELAELRETQGFRQLLSDQGLTKNLR